MAKISGGANSFLLKALLQAIVDTNAIPGEKIEPLTKRFTERVNETDTAKKNPAEVLRHVGEVLGWLYPLGLKKSEPETSESSPGQKLADKFSAFVVDEAPLTEQTVEAELKRTRELFEKSYDMRGTQLPTSPAFYPNPQPILDAALKHKTDTDTSGHLDVAKALEGAGISVAPRVDLKLDPADIDLLLDEVDVEAPPSPRSALQAALEDVAERFSKSLRHPFIESLTCEGKRYIVVGTATIRSAKREGVGRSANCTAKNYRRIKDADESILVHVDGRPVCATRELESGVCFVWLLHHTPGLVIRFWLNESDNGQRKDNPKGTYRITLVDDETGWKKAA